MASPHIWRQKVKKIYFRDMSWRKKKARPGFSMTFSICLPSQLVGMLRSIKISMEKWWRVAKTHFKNRIFSFLSFYAHKSQNGIRDISKTANVREKSFGSFISEVITNNKNDFGPNLRGSLLGSVLLLYKLPQVFLDFSTKLHQLP